MRKNKYGAPVTVLLVAVIIFGLFHKIILNANHVSFADSGDGLKSTFGTVYHLRYDSSYWHTSAMNYPFGESLFFTGNQVVLTNTLKLLKDAGWDLSEYALGISNILIILSYIIASLFIYLIFRELNVDWWMAMVATVLIILLSNQWERLELTSARCMISRCSCKSSAAPPRSSCSRSRDEQRRRCCVAHRPWWKGVTA